MEKIKQVLVAVLGLFWLQLTHTQNGLSKKEFIGSLKMSRGCLISDISAFRGLNSAIKDVTLFLHLLTLLSSVLLHSWVSFLHMTGNMARTALGLYDPHGLQSLRNTHTKKLFTLIVYISTVRGRLCLF